MEESHYMKSSTESIKNIYQNITKYDLLDVIEAIEEYCFNQIEYIKEEEPHATRHIDRCEKTLEIMSDFYIFADNIEEE